MSYLTTEKRAELRELLDSTGYDGSEPLRDWMMSHLAGRTHAATVDAAVNALPALLDAADERDRLAAQVESLAEWHETKAEKARRFRPDTNGENRVMDKAAEVHDDAAWRIRRALAGGA